MGEPNDDTADVAATEITIYSRDPCHLCEEAAATIERVAETVETRVRIEHVDVDTDPELREAYGDRVPYVLIDGEPAFKYRVDETALRDRLQRASRKS